MALIWRVQQDSTILLRNQPLEQLLRRFSSGTQKWNDINLHRQCFDQIGKKLGIKTFEDWYQIKKGQVSRDQTVILGPEKNQWTPNKVLNLYKGSLPVALASIFPENDWDPWRFSELSKSFWNDVKYQRKFFDKLGKKLGYKNWEDWYQIKASDIYDNNGSQILRMYQNSEVVALAYIYREHSWDIWKFIHATKSNFVIDGVKDAVMERTLFERLAKKLKLDSWVDWYRVGVADVHLQGDSRLLNINYGGNLYNALISVFPEAHWLAWKFVDARKASFQSPKVQREFMDDLAQQLKYDTWEDWYNAKETDVTSREGGEELLKMFNMSLVFALLTIFPERPWRLWKFMHVSNREKLQKEFWADPKVQREFLDELRTNFKITHWEQWYPINSHTFRVNGASGILRHYEDSIEKMMCALYPEHPWEAHRFSEKEEGYWTNSDIQKDFFDRLFKRLQLKDWTDWYTVPLEKIVDEGGGSIIQSCGGTQTKALIKAYPHHPWKMWKFPRVSAGFWDQEENVRSFVEDIGKELGVTHLDDWFKVSVREVVLLGGALVLHQYGGLHQLLSAMYPYHNWKQPQTGRALAIEPKSQRILFQEIVKIFPNVEDVYVCYPHPGMTFSDSGKPMELDIYLPKIHLAFVSNCLVEYQGVQHYKAGYVAGPNSDVRKRDLEKQKAASQIGITIIEIPYWWDSRPESLVATIHRCRPDLIPDQGKGQPIRDTPPNRTSKPSDENQLSLNQAING